MLEMLEISTINLIASFPISMLGSEDILPATFFSSQQYPTYPFRPQSIPEAE